ncbi:MAG: hypothetical protein IZT59_02060 [Verrucomicrobia bacterium]|jgi:uncharacterized membrane protein required for colicin V production|nr:hypothetical protein [Verrucomicrobiota bacterium]|tara:strand:+ start:49605 stop:50375 length:771 start_codon:yes stop_codon:yes gene_type:complete
MDTLPEISLGTAALIIFGLCAGYMFIRGLARTFVNTAFLVISAWVGFRVWQQAPSLAISWFGQPSELIATGLPIVAFLASLLVLRKIIKFFRAPVPKTAEDIAPKSSGQLVFRLLVTIIPAALLCLTVATLVHHASSVAEIRNSAEFGTSSPPSPSLAERLKNSISVAIPQSLMDKLDPLTAQPRLRLAKMIAASPDKPLEPVLDPETGRPYPRAIIVDDPELMNLAKEGRFSTLLRHPLLSEALKDPLTRQALGL